MLHRQFGEDGSDHRNRFLSHGLSQNRSEQTAPNSRPRHRPAGGDRLQATAIATAARLAIRSHGDVAQLADASTNWPPLNATAPRPPAKLTTTKIVHAAPATVARLEQIARCHRMSRRRRNAEAFFQIASRSPALQPSQDRAPAAIFPDRRPAGPADRRRVRVTVPRPRMHLAPPASPPDSAVPGRCLESEKSPLRPRAASRPIPPRPGCSDGFRPPGS